MKQAILLPADRIVNVGGWQNNCGANVFLHTLVDHWDFIPFQQSPFSDLINKLASDLGVEPTATAVKDLVDAMNFVEQEMIIGPLIRRFMVETLAKIADYKQSLFESFQLAVSSRLVGNPVEANDKKFLLANREMIKTLMALRPKQAFVLEDFWQDLQKNLPGEETYLQSYWRLKGFAKTLEYMGNFQRAYMFSQDELQLFAKSLGFRIRLIYLDQDMTMADQPAEPLLGLTLNNSGLHWQYLAPDHLHDKVIAQRNKMVETMPYGQHNRFNRFLEEPALWDARAAALILKAKPITWLAKRPVESKHPGKTRHKP